MATANALEVPLARPFPAPLPDGPRTGPLGRQGQRSTSGSDDWFEPVRDGAAFPAPAARRTKPEEDA